MGKRGNGEGSIYQRNNGTWAAQYTVWTAEGRKRRSVSGKTRAEASRKLTEAMSNRDGGLIYDAGKLTVGKYLDRWLADSVKGTLREITYANYSYITLRLPRPTWCIKPGARVNCGHGRRGPSARTLVVGGGPGTGASTRGSSPTSPDGADRAKVGAPLGELREILSGGGGADAKGACGERYERTCLSRSHGSG